MGPQLNVGQSRKVCTRQFAKRLARWAAAAVFASGALPAEAVDLERQIPFSIPSQSLSSALMLFAEQAKIQVLMASNDLARFNTKGAQGQLSLRAALNEILKGTNLTYTEVGEGTITISRIPDQRTRAEQGPPESAEKLKPLDLEQVTVTGSHIRGGDTASQVITVDSARIREEGHTDLGEVIRSLPQNFSGGMNPGIAGAAGISNSGVTGGSGLNLRGLGSDATLTLLNGRRLAYEGHAQAVDISAIPVAAVERIEIIPDGASAIYGSDAVAGVGNVILKRDFNGVTGSARYGAATEGGLKTVEYTATGGTAWDSGGFIVTMNQTHTDPIYSDQRSYSRYLPGPYTMYPGGEVRGGLLSAHQSFGGFAEMRLDLLHNDRDNNLLNAYPTYYYDTQGKTSNTLVAPSVEFAIGGDWSATLGGTYGKDTNEERSILIGTPGGEVMYDGTDCYCNHSRSYDLGAEGPVIDLPAGNTRMAVGIGYRKDESLNRSAASGARSEGSHGSRYVYAELHVPLIAPQMAIGLARSLNFTVAMRGEDYNGIGRVNTPKLGLIYDPNADFTLKGSWGKSFKTPTLLQEYSRNTVYLWTAASVGGVGYPSDATALMTYGGNRNLEPERARSWTTSLAFHPEDAPGLNAEVAYFSIDYSNRVVEGAAVYWTALGDPLYDDFVIRSPTADQIAATYASSPVFTNYSGADYDPTKVIAIIDDKYTNAVRQRISGVDLTASYAFTLGSGSLTLRGASSWLRSTQQNSLSQPEAPLAGKIYNPPKFTGRAGAVWKQGGFTATGFVQYVGSVTSKLTGVTEETGAFPTLDATLRYDTEARGSFWSDIGFALAATNLLDRHPPQNMPIEDTQVSFDSTNYSPIGRFLSFTISKHL